MTWSHQTGQGQGWDIHLGGLVWTSCRCGHRLQLLRETVSVDGSWGAQGPLSTARQGETPLCFTTAHHQGPAGALKGCSFCPGTDDMSATMSP